MVEQHLEQRVVADITLRLQGFNQLLERQILVRLCLQRRLPDLLQQCRHRHVRIDACLHDLSIDEEADQALSLQLMTVGHWHTHTNRRLPAVAMQDDLQGRQQDHI
ncbi:hypothetical protein D3C78_460520 [compost metagenome]